MAQVTIRLTLTQAELAKEIIESDLAHSKRVATDLDYATALSGGVDIRAYQREAGRRVIASEQLLKEFD